MPHPISIRGSTSLAEFTLAGSSSGTDWYDVSNVDAYDFPISIAMSNGLGYEPTYTTDVISQCPAALQVIGAVSGTLAYFQNPCNVYATPQVCCTMQAPQNCRDSVNGWPATAPPAQSVDRWMTRRPQSCILMPGALLLSHAPVLFHCTIHLRIAQRAVTPPMSIASMSDGFCC